MSKIYHNKWNGEKFESESFCTLCGKKASVIEMGKELVCGNCLSEKTIELQKSTLEDIVKRTEDKIKEEQLPKWPDTFCPSSGVYRKEGN